MHDPLASLSLAPRSDAERAYQTIRRELLNGEWLPLERLRPSALQQRFAFGLTPIREALTRLASDGLVQGESQRGFRACGVSFAEWKDLMATRRELERNCLTLAIQNGDATWEARVVAAMHLFARTPLTKSTTDRKAAELWEVRHRAFHYALVSACGSAWRLRFWTTLADHSERYRKLRLLRRKDRAAKVRNIVGDHQAIMEAVLARNTAKAVRLMDDHLASTEAAISEMLHLAGGKNGSSGKGDRNGKA